MLQYVTQYALWRHPTMWRHNGYILQHAYYAAICNHYDVTWSGDVIGQLTIRLSTDNFLYVLSSAEIKHVSHLFLDTQCQKLYCHDDITYVIMLGSNIHLDLINTQYRPIVRFCHELHQKKNFIGYDPTMTTSSRRVTSSVMWLFVCLCTLSYRLPIGNNPPISLSFWDT